jgi:ParB family chromosome partitioning protein
MNDKRKVLGRGLDSLLPGARATAVAVAPLPEGTGVRDIPIEEIERNPYQTRTHLDEVALHELAASIRANGVVQPVVVRLVGGKYQLIAGERRWRASKLAGKETVPAIVKEVSNEQAMEMTIIENLQREDLNPVEQARAYERLAREFNLTQEQMAARTGKDRSSIANFVRLLKLPMEVQLDLESGGLSFGHAKVLMMVDDAETQRKLGKEAVELALSVRQLEEVIHELLHPAEKGHREPRAVDPNVREAERELERALGVRVEIRDRGGKGKIILRYGSLEDYDRVLEMLNRK